MKKTAWALGLGLVLASAGCALDDGATDDLPTGASGRFEAQSGGAAAGYKLPADMLLKIERELPKSGLRYQRWQQVFGGAEVLGGQITMHLDNAGTIRFVAGAHHQLEAQNQVTLSKDEAIAMAAAQIIAADSHRATLMIDPATARYFYKVDSLGEGLRQIQWIDAEDGTLLNSYDAITEACDYSPGGVGFDGTQIDLAGLTNGSLLELAPRQRTRDLGSQKKPFYGTADDDADGCWDRVGRASPGQGALVSAHHHVAIADGYFQDEFGYNILTDLPTITVWAHYAVNYVNAYWDGTKLVFGDGDGVNFNELVGLDVAAHEFSHAVTEFHAGLIYQNESGALNESFSDIMGATIGFDTGIDADWLMGDDNDAKASDGLGFRDMSDPAAHGDPAHWCDRYTGTSDNGGVHINSGIPNHAYYLLVTTDNQAFGADEAARRARAADIFFAGFTALTSNATFLDARAATVNAALAAYGADAQAAVEAAWTAVGVYPGVTCQTTPPPAENCTDGIDNDGDLAVDCADSDCAADPSCTSEPPPPPICAAAGESCETGSDCCSNNCSTKGKNATFTCK